MAFNLLSLGGLVAFSSLFVLGIYFYRKGTSPRTHKTDKQLVTVPVQVKQPQVKSETLKVQNGKSKMPDIAERALIFLNGKKDEELEATPT
jgi:hypothetical protein